MPCKYTTKTGEIGHVDLDAVIDVARGPSGQKSTWNALVLYDPAAKIFIETRDSPIDCAHGTQSETVEVDESYLRAHFDLTASDLIGIKRHPELWMFRDA